jgi:hypothetical protein
MFLIDPKIRSGSVSGSDRRSHYISLSRWRERVRVDTRSIPLTFVLSPERLCRDHDEGKIWAGQTFRLLSFRMRSFMNGSSRSLQIKSFQ